ncbi:Protein tyrosine and serine/threonine kinase [Pelomyxa schiedti]|nr:Protein tyrosine and serine/threonine kinase [Pelomyxa schiedti]
MLQSHVGEEPWISNQSALAKNKLLIPHNIMTSLLKTNIQFPPHNWARSTSIQYNFRQWGGGEEASSPSPPLQSRLKCKKSTKNRIYPYNAETLGKDNKKKTYRGDMDRHRNTKNKPHTKKNNESESDNERACDDDTASEIQPHKDDDAARRSAAATDTEKGGADKERMAPTSGKAVPTTKTTNTTSTTSSTTSTPTQLRKSATKAATQPRKSHARSSSAATKVMTTTMTKMSAEIAEEPDCSGSEPEVETIYRRVKVFHRLCQLIIAPNHRIPDGPVLETATWDKLVSGIRNTRDIVDNWVANTKGVNIADELALWARESNYVLPEELLDHYAPDVWNGRYADQRQTKEETQAKAPKKKTAYKAPKDPLLVPTKTSLVLEVGIRLHLAGLFDIDAVPQAEPAAPAHRALVEVHDVGPATSPVIEPPAVLPLSDQDPQSGDAVESVDVTMEEAQSEVVGGSGGESEGAEAGNVERIAPPMLSAVGSIHAKEPEANGFAPQQPPIWNAHALPTIDRRDINYEERHPIGAGTLGTVYKATLRQHVNTDIAIKVMNKISHSETTRIAEILHNFNHENILKFLGMCPAVQYGQFDYLVFELMKCNLATILHSNQAQLEYRGKLQLTAGMLRGLNYLHSLLVIHGNLKSENCLVDDNFVLKICDFGSGEIRLRDYYELARTLPHTEWTGAPEVPFNKHFSFSSDMFDAGRVMHEIFTEGPEPKFVFRKFGFLEDFDSKNPSAPPTLNSVVEHCGSANPSVRPAVRMH